MELLDVYYDYGQRMGRVIARGDKSVLEILQLIEDEKILKSHGILFQELLNHLREKTVDTMI